LREWKISFESLMTDFIFHLSFIVPSPPIGRWIRSYIWPWRWRSHTALFQRSSELYYFRSAPFLNPLAGLNRRVVLVS
jgi:hypothetical protein